MNYNPVSEHTQFYSIPGAKGPHLLHDLSALAAARNLL